jgi:DNA integrity scanning protein DisA with diadenylate cyclase activity
MFLRDETDLLRDICTDKRGINLQTLEWVILLAVEIAREGREGRKIGTMFVVSDAPSCVFLTMVKLSPRSSQSSGYSDDMGCILQVPILCAVVNK